ncbi:aspartate/glutamate racemase family protein [Cellulosilyticum sp. I15G10I2]|uniref:aspartate/glutamate racemase family protein n=1 Tax=Cellulosilyticum sp. I15G10I2 TaxID=1892843 RepID=UPI00085C2430|nr:aspartate/glutamate racemase family protein [Cellulosilyticum sp. I15G10I2]
MKTIGLIGGMSWESTMSYYKIINTYIKEALGGLHSAKCILYSVDFQEIEGCQLKGEWDKAGEILSSAAKSLEKAGADFIILCTNTMHKNTKEICSRISIPFLHIADLTAKTLIDDKKTKVGLLGTKYTMEEHFYKGKLKDLGLEVVIPNEAERHFVNKVIFDELCLGKLKTSSKERFIKIIDALKAKGVEAVILGCTEIGILIKQEDSSLPLYDTAFIHATEAAKYALR